MAPFPARMDWDSATECGGTIMHDHALAAEAGQPVDVGVGAFRYRVPEDWAKLPAGWTFPEAAAVACDSRDRVFVFARGPHPVLVFDPDGTFLTSWGEGLFV